MRPAKKSYTVAEYLAMEQVADYKSEYYNGEIYAMSGGTSDHSLIAVNLVIELGLQLRAKPCRVYNSDMRLLVKRSGLYTYPDIMVICGKLEFVERRNDTVTNPLLIVEVLSESTREYDRGQKFLFYQQIPSLRDFVLVESESPHVEYYQRAEGDKWTVEILDGLDATVKLESLACEIPARQIYDKVSWLS